MATAGKWLMDKLGTKGVSQSGSENVNNVGTISGGSTGVVAGTLTVNVHPSPSSECRVRLGQFEVEIIQLVDQSRSGGLIAQSKGGRPYLTIDGKDIALNAKHATNLYEATEKLIAGSLLSDLGRGGTLYLTPEGRKAAGQLREQLDRGDRIDFANIERMMPELLTEMRKDTAQHPEIREIVVMTSEGMIYNGGDVFIYYESVHPKLNSFLQVLANNGLIHDITYNNVDRYRITEPFARYLISG